MIENINNGWNRQYKRYNTYFNDKSDCKDD